MRRDHHHVVEHNRRGDVAREPRLHREAPEQFAIRHIQAQHGVRHEIHDLLFAGHGRDDGRRVSGNFVLRFPDHPSGCLVEADHARAVRRSDRDEYPVTVDHRLAVVAVARRAGGLALFADEDRAETFREVDAPDFLPVRDREALQFAFARLRVNPRTIHQRRAARAGRALRILERVVDHRAPEFMAVGGIQRTERLLAFLIVEQKNFSRRDNRRGEAFTRLDAPEHFRFGGQGFGNGHTGGNMPGAKRPAPLRPVRRAGMAEQHCGQNKNACRTRE